VLRANTIVQFFGICEGFPNNTGLKIRADKININVGQIQFGTSSAPQPALGTAEKKRKFNLIASSRGVHSTSVLFFHVTFLVMTLLFSASENVPLAPVSFDNSDPNVVLSAAAYEMNEQPIASTSETKHVKEDISPPHDNLSNAEVSRDRKGKKKA
jgi:hypothetical protein